MLTDSISLKHFGTNGITVRAAVEGTGPLVIMVHGWPELWYSWQHQIRPIAESGFRVVGLIDALGKETAIGATIIDGEGHWIQ